ncbi:hypothetical protein, partial [Escherichia coli]|uniref:hypothetical protein n=2 Tax=Escherichia coli TaxID=562 RepID=UPI00227F7F12
MEAIEEWDCNTSYCRKFGWAKLTKAISNGEDVENLLTALHPFITEYVLSKEIDINDDVHGTLEYIEEHIDSLPYKTKSTLEKTKRNLIFDIYRDRFNDENVAVT